MGYFKIVYMVHAYNAQEHFSLVWSTSTNFKAYFSVAPCELRITHIRPRTLKRKSGCPSGIKNASVVVDVSDTKRANSRYDVSLITTCDLLKKRLLMAC